MKKISVIVINYNSKQYLNDLFESLKETDYPENDWRVVFVDNNSSDDSLEYAKKLYPNAHFIENKRNTGFAEGNNIGAKWAMENDYDYIVLLNQDTIVSPNWLKAMLEDLESNPSYGAIMPKLMLHPKIEYINNLGVKIQFLGFGYGDHADEKDEGQLKEVAKINYCSGACVMLSTELIKKIGLFDNEMFMYLEDLDLGWKISLLGYYNVITPRTFIYHKYNFSRSTKMIHHFEKNRFVILLTNYRFLTFLLLLPMLIVMEFGMLFFALKNKWIKKKLISYLYFFKPSTWIYIIKRKKHINNFRKVSDREIIKTFTPVIKFQEVSNPLLDYIGNPIMKIYYNIIKNLIIW